MQHFEAAALLSPYSLNRDERQKLFLYVLLFMAMVTLVFLFQRQAYETTVAAFLIAFSALLPGILWVRGKVLGLPLFPLYAISFLSTYATPLVFDHPVASRYSADEHLLLALKVSAFLLLSTLFWFLTCRRLPQIPRRYRALEESQAVLFFQVILLAAIAYQIVFLNGLVWQLPAGAVSILRALVLGLNMVGVFYIGFALGERSLSFRQRMLFIMSLLVFLAVTSLSLLLVQVIWTSILATLGFILGAKRIPIVTLVLLFLILSLLHVGKGQMRAEQWTKGSSPIQPWEYPGLMARWVELSFRSLLPAETPDDLYVELQEPTTAPSLLERSSLAHIFLLAQRKIGEGFPLLYGKTYALLPSQLLPRFLSPSKVTPLAGTRMLNIHYGLQSEESALNTTIGWGLLNEAYANFGVPGILVFAVLFGWCLARITLWCSFTPVLSARTFIGIAIMAFTSQPELSAGTLLPAIFQSTVVFFIFSQLYMRTYTLNIREQTDQFEPEG